MASAWGGAPHWWLPVDAARHGAGIDRHLLLNLWLASGLLFLLHVLLLSGLALRRRFGGSARSAALFEYVPVSLLTLLFAGLTVQAERLWAAARYVGPDRSAMQVEATGVQFAWYFRYPGKDAAFGRTRPELVAPGEGNAVGIDPEDTKGKDDFVSTELVLPVGREVDVRLRAQDVIHGFAVPELRVKQNAVPGQNFHVHFTPGGVGTYAVVCTQLCGLGHYRMGATLRVLPAAEFDRWLADKEETTQSGTPDSVETTARGIEGQRP